MLIFTIPPNFPHHGEPVASIRRTTDGLKPRLIRRVDILGATLLLLATLSLTAGFEEAGSQFPWKSAYVIALLTFSGVLWIILSIWERHLTLTQTVIEPVLPWRFFTSPAMLSLML